MACLFESLEPAVRFCVGFRLQSKIDEQAIAAVVCRLTQGFTRHRYQTLTLFPGAFCNQLFGPVGEYCYSWRADEAYLIAPRPRGFRQDDAQSHAGIIFRRDAASTGMH